MAVMTLGLSTRGVPRACKGAAEARARSSIDDQSYYSVLYASTVLDSRFQNVRRFSVR